MINYCRKTALITGAGSGIGRATAVRFADTILFLIRHGDTMMIDEIQIHRATKEPFIG